MSTVLSDAQLPFVLPLSADSFEALEDRARGCAEYLRSSGQITRADLLHAATGAGDGPWRCVAIGADAQTLARVLEGSASSEDLISGDAPTERPVPGLAFSGGADRTLEWANGLYESFEVVRETFDACDAEYSATWGGDLRSTVLGGTSEHGDGAEEVAFFSIQASLAALARHLGVAASIVLGDGRGDIAAWHAAGALSLTDALHLAAFRAQLGHNGRASSDAGTAKLQVEASAMEWGSLQLPTVISGVLQPAGSVPQADAVLLHPRGATDTVRGASEHGHASIVVQVGRGLGVLATDPRGPAGPAQSPERSAGDPVHGVLRTLARLHCKGVEIDWRALSPADSTHALVLPDRPTVAQSPDPPPVEAPVEAENGSPPEHPVSSIVSKIRNLTAQELGLAADDVAEDATFFDLGADSLSMIDMLREVEDAFSVSVSMRELFEEADTPRALAKMVLARAPAPAEPSTSPAEKPAIAPAVAPPPAASEQTHGPRTEVAPDSGMAGQDLERDQESHVEELIRDVAARTAGSKEQASRFRRRLADSRAVVGFRTSTKELLYPLSAESAHGAHIVDVDGNSYVDITMGFGILLFGHDPPFVRDAITSHLERGIRLGPRSEDTGVAAELLCEMTGSDRVAFATSGTEAISAALRLARAATDRSKVVMFRGAYHGHFDAVLARSVGSGAARRTVPVSRGIPASAVEDIIVLDYDDESSLEHIERLGTDVAAIVVEPVQSRHPSVQPQAFLEELRRLADRLNAVLVFDEMLTGFRCHPRGAQGHFGVDADLVTYGKVLGGGLPIGAVAGRAELLDGIDGGQWAYGDESHPKSDTTFFGGTYIQHPLAMAAARATLEHLKSAGPQLQRDLSNRMEGLAADLNGFFADEEFPLELEHFGSQFRFALRRDLDLMFPHLLKRGVYVWEWRNFFLSTAHSDADVATVSTAVKESLTELRRAELLPPRSGPPRSGDGPRPTPSPDGQAANPVRSRAKYSLYFFGDYPSDTPPAERYEIVLESARHADREGFHALWFPERHFNSFGGIFPNPSVLAAALARETRSIRLNAGSVVLPLHHPVRVAEEWSVVDNLSGGRVGLAFASGWHPNDFALRPEAYGDHKSEMYDQIEDVRTLWRGDSIAGVSGSGESIDLALFPRPIQGMPPMFVAIVGNPESYRLAGENDLGVVTNLMSQDIENLAANLRIYRESRAQAGLDPHGGQIVVLLHTFLGETIESARSEAFPAFRNYMMSSLSLFGQVSNSLGMNIDLDRTSPEDLEFMMEKAYDRYCEGRALIGTVESSAPVIDALEQLGVSEVACFVDFGVSLAQVRSSLPLMTKLMGSGADPAGPDGTSDAPSPTIGDAESSGPAVRPFPLATTQERMWFAEQLVPGLKSYYERRAVRIDGPVDVDALANAVQDVGETHSMLRAHLVTSDSGDPHQTVSARGLALDVVGDPEEGVSSKSRLEAVLAEGEERGFDLQRGPLFRCRLLLCAEDRHVLLFEMHHIVFDTLSAAVFVRDLEKAYAARTEGIAPSLAPEDATYEAYVSLQVERGADPKTAEALRYWERRLADLPPTLDLPTDHPRLSAPTGRGSTRVRHLSRTLSAEVAECARRHRATPFMVMSTAYALVLRAMSGQSDLVIGTPIADRPRRFAGTVGLFVNTLALRFDLSRPASLSEAIENVRTVMLDAQDHSAAPFDEVVRRVNPVRDTSRNPIFQVMIEYEGDEPFEFDLAGLEVTPIDVQPRKSPFDLTLYLSHRDGEIRCGWEYSTELFNEETIDSYADAFQTALEAMVARPDDGLGDVLSAFADEERLRAVECGPELPPTTGFSDVGALVREQARATPGTVAIEMADGLTVSYRELVERAEQWAGRLRAAGAIESASVVLHLDSAADAAVGMLATVFAGCAYVPIDPSLPDGRKEFIAKDCGARVALVSHMTSTRSWSHTPLEEVLAAPGRQAAVGVEATAVEADSTAYVLYTSGSTGQPKGVAMTQRGLAHLTRWHCANHGPARTLQNAAIGFDVASQEVFTTWANGGTLAFGQEQAKYEPEKMVLQLRERGIERLFISATPLRYLTTEFARVGVPEHVREIITAGEALVLDDDLRSVMERTPALRVFNQYGPTETHVVSEHLVTSTDPVGAPIGKPVPGMRLQLMGSDGMRVPYGAAGEICVSGPQLAAGYVGRASETSDRFVGQDGSAPSYRTGDIGRWNSRGELEFLGRNDEQIKIRGTRVEPGEIRALLTRLPSLADAAVVGWAPSPGEVALAAYLVVEPAWDADDETLVRELRRTLSASVPEAMVPTSWTCVTSLPRSENGKLDRRALPEPNRADASAAANRPETDTERAVEAAWTMELAIKEVGTRTSFFEAGGHSLNAVRVVNRLREQFEVDLSLAQFFGEPTIEAVATAIDSLEGASDLTGPQTAARVAGTL